MVDRCSEGGDVAELPTWSRLLAIEMRVRSGNGQRRVEMFGGIVDTWATDDVGHGCRRAPQRGAPEGQVEDRPEVLLEL